MRPPRSPGSVDAAVVCCLPLTRGDWLERPRDFIYANAATHGIGDAGKLWQLFEPEAAFIREKLASFRAAGLGVYERAGEMQIREASAMYPDVVVLAHWKDEFVLPADLPPRLAEEQPQEIVNQLNRLIVGEEERQQQGSALEEAIPSSVRRREELEQTLSLAPGNRIETFDGLLTPAAFSRLFPTAFSGTLFAAICHSHLLCEWFRRDHPDSISLCAPATTRAGLVLTKLHAAFTIMATTNVPLWKALIEADDIIDSL